MWTLARNEIPAWAEPYIAALLALGAGVLLVFAAKSAINSRLAPKKRWGSVIGYIGLSTCFATMSCGLMFEIDLMPTAFSVFLAGFVLTGVGGSIAGWKRRPVVAA